MTKHKMAGEDSAHPYVDFEDKSIKETYPLEEKKKMVVFYAVSKVLWQGDEYSYADAKIIYCCEKAEKDLIFCGNNIPSPGSNPTNFGRMVYQGKPVDNCPFCGAEIAINK